jgi:glycosyltransferase involved in cell wall biosynthesis
LVFRGLIPLARWTADAVLTDSQQSKHDLVRYAHFEPSQVHITSCGTHVPSEADLDRWRSRRIYLEERFGLQGPYFLYVGALNPRKNVPRLIESFKRVRSVHSNVRLVIVGPETWWADETLKEAKDLHDAVRLTGYVDDEVLHILYTLASVVVFPSLYEGFGLPPLEGMAHGTPVITSRASSLPEVVGDAAVLVDPLSVSSIADAMSRVVSDGGLAAELSLKGRARAADFTWDRVGDATLAVYREMLAGRG